MLRVSNLVAPRLSIRLAAILLVPLFLSAGVPGVAGAAVCYVDAGAAAGGDGLTWDTAFVDLQDALARAAGEPGSVEQIWVAAGTYKPDRGTGDRTATFQLLSGVALYGGFAGDEMAVDQRDPAVNVTILSGDLAGDDGADPANNVENSCHVLTGSGCNQAAVLDGFTIRAGHADGASHDGRGGGLLNIQGSPTVRGCRFEENVAFFGAGVSNYNNSSGVFEDCAFVGNRAVLDGTSVSGAGAGIDAHSRSPVTVTRCTFEDNVCSHGALALRTLSDGVVTECTFRNNLSEGPYSYGGAIYVDNCNMLVSDCLFDGNAADQGGAYGHVMRGTCQLVRCRFLGNVAASMGGAIRASSVKLFVEQCEFRQNRAVEGGGLCVNACSPVLLGSCLLAGNVGGYGGAMDLAGSNTEIRNCTVVGNVSEYGLGGAIFTPYGSFVLRNSIFRDNGDLAALPLFFSRICIGVSNATVMHCNVQGGPGSVYVHPDSTLNWLGGNRDVEPQFVDAAGGDYRLLPTCLCVDAGDPAQQPEPGEADLDGNPRCTGLRTDLGCYETQVLRGDITGDGSINELDLAALAGAWASAAGDANFAPACDLDGNGRIDGRDLLMLAVNWPGPAN